MCVFLTVLICSLSYGDKIYLKNGTIVEGEIVEITDTYIIVEDKGRWRQIDIKEIAKHTTREKHTRIPYVNRSRLYDAGEHLKKSATASFVSLGLSVLGTIGVLLGATGSSEYRVVFGLVGLLCSIGALGAHITSLWELGHAGEALKHSSEK